MPRRSHRLSLLLLILAFAAWARAGDQPAPNRAILVRDADVRVAPDESSTQLGTSSRGRELVIMAESHDWLNVMAQIEPRGEEATGWILNKGVVRTSTPNADRIVFGEASDSEDEASRPRGRRGAAQEAMRLYARLAEYFPKSPLAGEAAYRAADIKWQLERNDVMTLPSAREEDPSARPQIDEDDMREVIKKFPRTKWADLAAFDLIDNKLCGDWMAESKCPERESEIYERYVKEHPESPKAAEALYDAAWRQSALIEIYKTENDLGHSTQAQNKALALANQIATQFPQSDWAYRATDLIYKIQQNIPTYGSAKE